MDLCLTASGTIDALAQVWPTWAVCGMYALGTAPSRDDTQLHMELCEILGATVPLVLLDAQSMTWTAWLRHDTWTPIAIDVRPDPTEQVVLEDAVGMASYTDELCSVDQRGAQRQLQTLTAERRSVAALHDRLVAACAYMERACCDPSAYDATTLRHLATAVAHRPPTRDAAATADASVDALLATYLAAATKNLHTLQDRPPPAGPSALHRVK
ncbi:hypothetical protein MCAP1_001552 [Malassezia caprae]|uniref:EIF3F/CSN6-like C-terminal domain-containing protein n=1 Tax=Malassezia caprae TaxID=1381934 RepID=A0AAF0E797_9BASI|nr:hypothetical protein MCAP1_001552 [Malassezia caprae]